MATGKTTKKQQLALSAVTVNPASTLSYDVQSRTERPSNFRDIVKRCRLLAVESSFLNTYLPLKLSFYNSGLVFNTGKLSKAKSDVLDTWLEKEYTIDAEYVDPSTSEKVKIETNMTNGEAIRRFVKNVWQEYLLIDNVIGMWLDDGRAPVCLPPEKCRYIDKLGLQILYYTHGLGEKDIELLDKNQQKRFAQRSELLLNPDEGEHFKILKRGLDGGGFVSPSIFSIFRTLGEIESKEIGMHARAFQMRGSCQHIKIGHNYTAGPAAGKSTHFWNTKTGNAASLAHNKRVGPYTYTSNFDQEIEYPWPAIEAFDEVAWKGSDLRLRNWGGPVAQMLLAEKVVDGALNTLRVQVTEDRSDVRDFLLPIIKIAFNVPKNVDLDLQWSDLCFIDSKQASDLIKFGVQNGLCSVKTARRVIGLNHDEENTLKANEADDTDAQKHYRPAWDTQHAMAPQAGETAATMAATAAKAKGADSGSTNGRPAGAKDSAAATR